MIVKKLNYKKVIVCLIFLVIIIFIIVKSIDKYSEKSFSPKVFTNPNYIAVLFKDIGTSYFKDIYGSLIYNRQADIFKKDELKKVVHLIKNLPLKEIKVEEDKNI